MSPNMGHLCVLIPLISESLYIRSVIIYYSEYMVKLVAGMELKFKVNGRFISLLKDGKLTRSDVITLINEAKKRNIIVDLSGRDLHNLDLSKLSLGRANLSNANLSNTNLSNATFFDANVSNSDLSNSNLSFTDFSYANLSHTKMIGANMSNAVMLKTIVSI